MGPIGVILSEPDGPPRASLVLLQGGGAPCRAGINSNLTRLARTLATEGLAVLRFDFVGEGDSTTAASEVPREVGWRRNSDLIVLRELAAWFRGQIGTTKLLLAGECHGARIAMDFACEDPDVAATLMVVPYLSNLPPGLRSDKQANPRLSLPRASALFDHGSSDVAAFKRTVGEVEAVADDAPLDESFVDSCRGALARGPVWILIGAGDSQKPLELKRRLGEDGRHLEVEVIPDMIVHPVVYPEVQSAVRDRLTARIAAVLA